MTDYATSLGMNGLWRAATGGVLHRREAPYPGHVMVWWGAVLRVEPGDFIEFFPTPWGICIEAVVRKDWFEVKPKGHIDGGIFTQKERGAP